MVKRTAVVLTVGGLFWGLAAEAEGATRVCQRVEDEMFAIDGMLDDWRGIRASRAGGKSADASFELRCAYDSARLYLSVNVSDERLVRTRKAQAKAEDGLSIRLSAGGKPLSMRLLPGSVTTKPARVAPRYVEIEDSLQRRGFSAEVAIPLSRIARWSRSTPALDAVIVYHDTDKATARAIQSRVTFSGRLEFSDAYAVYKSFLKAAKLRRSDIRLDTIADVDPGTGAERIIAGGRVIGILGESFTYMVLPVASAADVLGVKVVDLSGDGRSAIVGHYRQRGNGGSREVVSVWNVRGDGRFDVALAFEVKKEMGDRRLTNTWKLVPPGEYRRGKKRRGKRARGRDILIEIGEVIGWDEDSYNEMPAPDVKPILLPWSEQTSAVYYFDGDAALGGDPKVGR